LKQTHSNKFHYIDKKYKVKNKKLIGDALITNLKGIAIGVLTADCVPILIYDKDKNIISAIHAGWRGAFKGILNNVVEFLVKKGSNTKNLIAVIGPCISINDYEIQKDFQDKFIKKIIKIRYFLKKLKIKHILA